MKKLPQSGELYMNDYPALKYAEDQMNEFLDTILSNTKHLLNKQKQDRHTKEGKWKVISKNNSRSGRIKFTADFNWNNQLEESTENNIAILYRDIRSYTKMDSAWWIRLSIFGKRDLKDQLLNVENNILERAKEMAKEENVHISIVQGEPLYKTWVSINAEDSEDTAKRVAEEMTRLAKGIDLFLSEIINTELRKPK